MLEFQQFVETESHHEWNLSCFDSTVMTSTFALCWNAFDVVRARSQNWPTTGLSSQNPLHCHPIAMSPRERPQLESDHPSSSFLDTKKEARKSVRFSEIKIREYNRTVSDHPEAVGVPIGLDWSFIENPATPIDQYERERPMKRRNLRLSSITRKNLLINVFQVDESEIHRADNEVKRIKKQRENSLKQGKIAAHMESAFLSTKRKFRKTFFSREELFQGFAMASGLPPLAAF
jgi:hypothetical protein